MPPASKRRRTTSGGPAAVSSKSTSAKVAQSTLSFRSSKAGARATDTKKADLQKPAISSHEKPLKTDITTPEEEEVTTPQEEVEVSHAQAIKIEDPTANILQEAEPAEEVEDEENDEDEAEADLNSKALGLSEAKIKSYWTEKENERKAPRVHQKGLSVREKVLREFDMSSRYGPSIGITRLARWRRAQNMGTNPPIEVLAVLLKEDQIKGKADGATAAHQTSVIDDLIMSSRMRDGSLAET